LDIIYTTTKYILGYNVLMRTILKFWSNNVEDQESVFRSFWKLVISKHWDGLLNTNWQI